MADVDVDDFLEFGFERAHMDEDEDTVEDTIEFKPFKVPHTPGRGLCGLKGGCTTCKGCVCVKTYKQKCSTECGCSDACLNLQKNDKKLEDTWSVNGTFEKVDVPHPQESGPTNLPEKLTLLESANLIWDEFVINHVHNRTNWKKEYCI